MQTEAFTFPLNDNEEFSGYLPVQYVVCPRCEGSGAHVNPSIDGNGLSEELRADYDFMEDYMAGVYDIVCECCNGKRVVAEPDFAKWKPGLVAAYRAHLEEEAYFAAVQAAELRAGA